MNRKTILSSNFPDFVEKWKKFKHKFKHIDSWYIVSDYCLDDNSKPNDVMTFTILPFLNPYALNHEIKIHLPKDIKDIKNLSEEAIKFIKDSPYFFSLAFVIKNKNSIFSLDTSKCALDKAIKEMENWPYSKREEFIHKMKRLRNYLNRKEVDLKTLSDISITGHIMSAIIEFLLIKYNTKHIIWISDRDRITSFQDGVIRELVSIGYASLLNKRVPNHEVFGFWGGKEYRKEIFDELVRIPDYISGSIASMNFENVESIQGKHYDLFDKSIVDNERIQIMQLEKHQNEDILGELRFTRN